LGSIGAEFEGALRRFRKLLTKQVVGPSRLCAVPADSDFVWERPAPYPPPPHCATPWGPCLPPP
jgi:hypothetical protein